MNFTDEQYVQINFIRSIAVVLILITHISQEYKWGIGAYTNVGVQVFLAISAFIYAQQKNIEWTKWYKKRVLRIIPPYYLLLTVTFILYLIILNKNILSAQYLTHFTTLHFLFYPSYPYWGGHLWYLTAITICYILLPTLCYIYSKYNRYNIYIFFIIIPILLFIIFYKTSLPYRLSGDIYSFIIPFFIGRRFAYYTTVDLVSWLTANGFNRLSCLNRSTSM